MERVPVTIVGVPLDLGASRRGTDMGPSAIRYARLQEALQSLGHEVADQGNIEVPVPESREAGHSSAKYLQTIASVTQVLGAQVAEILRSGRVPVVLGGDHSINIGSMAGAASVLDDFGVLWIDAHSDFNTPETSPSGNIHGMPLAVAVGLGAPDLVNVLAPGRKVDPAQVAIVGARSIDAEERTLLRSSTVSVFTMKEIDQLGFARTMEEAIAIASNGGKRGLFVSFDLDAVDPTYAPGVGTPISGGLTYREAHLAMELVAETGLLRVMEVVEVNPILDQGNRTAQMAVGLIQSALGKRIL